LAWEWGRWDKGEGLFFLFRVSSLSLDPPLSPLPRSPSFVLSHYSDTRTQVHKSIHMHAKNIHILTHIHKHTLPFFLIHIHKRAQLYTNTHTFSLSLYLSLSLSLSLSRSFSLTHTHTYSHTDGRPVCTASATRMLGSVRRGCTRRLIPQHSGVHRRPADSGGGSVFVFVAHENAEYDGRE